MTTLSLTLPRPRTRPHARERARTRRIPVEGLLIFVAVATFYALAGAWLDFHMHYMIDDAYARIDNAFDVLFTSDPHLAALGFFWPPLPSFLELPIIAFKNVWPPLVTQGFAGVIEAALFGAGTVVVINAGARWAGVVPPLRWLICLAWIANPMILIYSTEGMSEAPFMFFFVASLVLFLVWTENPRPVYLPVMGALAGLGCLCRNESLIIALLLGAAVIAIGVRRRDSFGNVENAALMYALPAAFFVLLWLGTAAILFNDPLYWLHANGIDVLASKTSATAVANAAAAGSGVSRAQAFDNISVPGFGASASFVLGHSLQLYPGVLAMLAALGVRMITRGNRLALLVLLACGLAIPAVDMLIIQQGLGPFLRYQIAVIPFTFVLAIFLLRGVRGEHGLRSSLVAVGVIAVLALSNVQTAMTISDPSLGQQEAPLIDALAAGKPVPEATPVINKIIIGERITPRILALDRDHGRILCDSSTCFPIVLNAPNPTIFRVTSDRSFQASAAAPLEYRVEYFLVPALQGQGAFDQLNVLYPMLWKDGGGFASLVGVVNGDPSMGQWRLYRIHADPTVVNG
ncbi:MAG: hypothetical protein JOZ75_09415 [Candidatus Dormibacteraeota bacterium]|nr:hypothetical protein [Candidatus Dormibacteraeota bacterium]